MKTWIPLLALLASFGLYGCNTTEGLGKDIEATGEVISDTAEDTAEEIDEMRD